MIWRGAFLQIFLCSIAMTTDINAGRLNDENYIETNTVKGDQLVIFILPEHLHNLIQNLWRVTSFIALNDFPAMVDCNNGTTPSAGTLLNVTRGPLSTFKCTCCFLITLFKSIIIYHTGVFT